MAYTLQPITPQSNPYPGYPARPMDQPPYPEVMGNPVADFTSPINNTTPTGAPPASQSTVQANSIPMPIGGVRSPVAPGALQSTMADRPPHYPSPEEQLGAGYGAAAMGGIGAGGNVAATTNASDALGQVAGSTLTGAAEGALYGSMAGGPGALVGGAVGGVAGLVTSGINAYVGLRAARDAKRQQEKINAQILARQEARYQQERADQAMYFNINRSDELEKERYTRRMNAVQTTWNAQQAAAKALNDNLSQDQNFRQYLTATVR